MPVRVISKFDSFDGLIIDTTSRSKEDWSCALSPFFLGPCDLYGGFTSKNMENGWQYVKVYKQHTNEYGEPNNEYWSWAKAGWAKQWADRYPMKKGAVPEYSYWDGEKLGYIEARKQIYIPLYSKAVRKTKAYKTLEEIYRSERRFVLSDFDGYDYLKLNMTLDQVLNNPSKKMGHAFVLAMMLEEII